MNIYLLKNLTANHLYDVAEGFVIVAETPASARKMAASRCGDEGSEVWLSAATSSCRKVGVAIESAKPEILMRDFVRG